MVHVAQVCDGADERRPIPTPILFLDESSGSGSMATAAKPERLIDYEGCPAHSATARRLRVRATPRATRGDTRRLALVLSRWPWLRRSESSSNARTSSIRLGTKFLAVNAEVRRLRARRPDCRCLGFLREAFYYLVMRNEMSAEAGRLRGSNRRGRECAKPPNRTSRERTFCCVAQKLRYD